MTQSRVGTAGTVAMMVRLTEELRDRIKAAADENKRSQNSEIIATLNEKYPAPKFPVILNEDFRRSLEHVSDSFDHILDIAKKIESEDSKKMRDALQQELLSSIEQQSELMKRAIETSNSRR